MELTIGTYTRTNVASVNVRYVDRISKHYANERLSGSPFQYRGMGLVQRRVKFGTLSGFGQAANTLLRLRRTLRPTLNTSLYNDANFTILFVDPIHNGARLHRLVRVFNASLSLGQRTIQTGRQNIRQLVTIHFEGNSVIFRTAQAQLMRTVRLPRRTVANIEVVSSRTRDMSIRS